MELMVINYYVYGNIQLNCIFYLMLFSFFFLLKFGFSYILLHVKIQIQYHNVADYQFKQEYDNGKMGT